MEKYLNQLDDRLNAEGIEAAVDLIKSTDPMDVWPDSELKDQYIRTLCDYCTDKFEQTIDLVESEDYEDARQANRMFDLIFLLLKRFYQLFDVPLKDMNEHIEQFKREWEQKIEDDEAMMAWEDEVREKYRQSNTVLGKNYARQFKFVLWQVMFHSCVNRLFLKEEDW